MTSILAMFYNTLYEVPIDVLRINHYKGKRFPDWSHDWDDIENRTVEDKAAYPVLRKLEEFRLDQQKLARGDEEDQL